MPRFLVLTGPSGAGKSTVIQHLTKQPIFELSVSCTTRKPRPGEIDGVHYYFISEADFKKKMEENFFIETTFFNGNYYGTPANNEDKDKIIILDVEVDGLKYFKKLAPRSFFCLVSISKKVMKDRLKKRMLACIEDASQFDETEFEKRMSTFEWYQESVKDFPFNAVIDNSYSIDKTLKQINQLVEDVLNYFK